MIIVEPSHGLCNRLRVIRSAINLAKKYSQELLVLWRVDSELHSRWEDLFLRTDYFSLINIEFLPKYYCAIRRKLNRGGRIVLSHS